MLTRAFHAYFSAIIRGVAQQFAFASRRPFPLNRMSNARLNRRVAQRLKRSSRGAAPPTFQNGAWIRLGLDRQRNREAAALFANQLEGLPVHQGDVRFNTHIESTHRKCINLK